VINICGSGRNVGKTYLGESIIANFSNQQEIIAIKISKFKHKPSDKFGLHKLHETSNFTIWKELDYTTKDSGRYLKAGAKLSFYIECDDSHILESFLFVKNNYCKSCLIVCESASITKYINPAVSIFVESAYLPTSQNKLRCLKQSTLVLKERSIEISMPQLFLTTKNRNWVAKYSKNSVCSK
jgi:hypothetical protein